MSKKTFVDSIEVKSPCGEDWNMMHGTDKVRFCSHCSTSVNNLSEMTRKQATRLVRSSNGNICIRYIAEPTTRKPMFAEQLLQIARRTPGVAAGVVSASIALSSQAYAQETPPTETPQIPAAERALDQNERTTAAGRISGSVLDPQGAVIQYATVSIFSVDVKTFQKTVTDLNGAYAFEKLDPGKYRIEVESDGFVKRVREVNVSDTHIIEDVSLAIGLETTVEIRADSKIESMVMGGAMISTSRSYSTALARAVANDDLDEAKDLIIRGHNVNGKERDFNKATPLFIAVENGNIEMVQLLLTFRAKVNIVDAEKQTPIMRLDDDATPEMVELLTRYGAKADLADKEGNTTLILAAGSVKAAVLKALIDAGADVRAKNKLGRTALMEAAENDDLESVKLLLDAGAKVNVRDKEGESAWDLTSDDEIEQLLESYGAETKGDDEDEPVIPVTTAPR